MNLKTEELLIITLAVVIFIAIFIAIDPNITGYATHEFSDYTYNENIVVNESIQLTPYPSGETYTTEETHYYTLTSVEKQEENETSNELQNLIFLDNNQTNLGKEDLLIIQFNNVLKSQDKINLYLENNQETTLNILNNEAIVATINYTGIAGFYQVILEDLQSNEFTLDTTEERIKINYINASHLEIIEHIIYFYNSDSIETETIEPENLDKWDMFTSNHELNNQTILFYYSTGENYTEFTPPYNFSSIDSPSLKFKLDLISDNSSTPVVYNLTINYIEKIEPPVEVASMPPSLTRYQSLTVTQTATETKTETVSAPKTETKSVPIKVETTPEPEAIQEFEKTPNTVRITGNAVAFSYLTFVCLLLYKKRHKKPKKAMGLETY